MKLLVFTTIFLASAFMANAQPEIPISVLPVANEKYIFVKCKKMNIQDATTGANVSWDFANLLSEKDSLEEWIPKNLIPATKVRNFPTATLASYNGDKAYSFHTVSGNSALFLGFSDESVENNFTQMPARINYPLKYNMAQSGDIKGTFSYAAAPVPGFAYGNFKLTPDAYGTLKLPNGTFQNVLRVKNVISIVDSLPIPGQAIVVNATTTNYEYYLPNVKHYILQISTSKISGIPGAGGTTTIMDTTILYQKNIVTGMDDLAASSEVNLFPNPTDNQATLNYALTESADAAIQILNSNGQIVNLVKLGYQTQGFYSKELDLTTLPAGLYFVRLTAGNQNLNKTLIITK